MSKNQKTLSERPLGYLLAIIAGTLALPLGWLVSPFVLFVLNKFIPKKDGYIPNRFKTWALIGCFAVPANIVFFSLVISPMIDRAVESDVRKCNKGVLDACEALLPFPRVHSRVRNPAFAKLQEKERKALKEKERLKHERTAEERRRQQAEIKKQKDAEREKIMARVKRKMADDEAKRIRLVAEQEKEYQRKFQEWTKSTNPWWGCLWSLKNQLRDPDSYRDDWASPKPSITGSTVSFVWRFRSKNGYGGYDVAVAACETAPDMSRSSGEWGGYGLPVVKIIQD
jgi:hypothetical protein